MFAKKIAAPVLVIAGLAGFGASIASAAPVPMHGPCAHHAPAAPSQTPTTGTTTATTGKATAKPTRAQIEAQRAAERKAVDTALKALSSDATYTADVAKVKGDVTALQTAFKADKGAKLTDDQKAQLKALFASLRTDEKAVNTLVQNTIKTAISSVAPAESTTGTTTTAAA